MGESQPKNPSSEPPRPLIHLEPGYRLDRYELLAPYAAGGMASIWLGRFRGKHDFERLVAVKTILPVYGADPDFRSMLIDEARLAARIRHTNVAEVLDVGDENGLLYMVMEWVNGDSLHTLSRTLAKRGAERLPLPIILRLAADVCRGLHAAHELRSKGGELLGVVHRDVSPQNILVDVDGVAKLIDFGVAKARERMSGQTTSGLIKGKARYMPPEQVLGRAIDRRTDVWAMGAVLQFLISGRTPYSEPNDVATWHKIASGEPPEPLPSDVPAAVRSVISRALAPDPDARHATADDLATALEEALQALGKRTSVSDVTRFLNDALAGLAERRKKAVELALSAAEERERMNLRLKTALSSSGKSQLLAPPPSARAADPTPATDASPARPSTASAAPTALLGSPLPRLEEGHSTASLESSIGSSESHRTRRFKIAVMAVAITVVASVTALGLRRPWERTAVQRAVGSSGATVLVTTATAGENPSSSSSSETPSPVASAVPSSEPSATPKKPSPPLVSVAPKPKPTPATPSARPQPPAPSTLW